jgi:hypothetical protein
MERVMQTHYPVAITVIEGGVTAFPSRFARH